MEENIYLNKNLISDAEDFISKHTPCLASQLVFSLGLIYNLDSATLDVLAKGIYRSVVNGRVFCGRETDQKKLDDIANTDIIFSTYPPKNRITMGHYMCLWALLLLIADEMTKNHAFMMSSRLAWKDHHRESCEHYFFYEKDVVKDAFGINEDIEETFYILNAERAMWGKIGDCVNNLNREHPDSTLIICASDQGIFNEIPDCNSKLIVFIFKDFRETGIPDVEMFRRNC